MNIYYCNIGGCAGLKAPAREAEYPARVYAELFDKAFKTQAARQYEACIEHGEGRFEANDARRTAPEALRLFRC